MKITIDAKKVAKEIIEEWVDDNNLTPVFQGQYYKNEDSGGVRDVEISDIIQKALEHFQEDKTVSDEEIAENVKIIKQLAITKPKNESARKAEKVAYDMWEQGAKWMRDKLTKQIIK